MEQTEMNHKTIVQRIAFALLALGRGRKYYKVCLRQLRAAVELVEKEMEKKAA
jgi:hypothetical protein